MRLPLFFLLLTFTVSACGFSPDWDGDLSKCDAVVDGACVVGLDPAMVARAHVLSQEHFGTSNLNGYLIERVSDGAKTTCNSHFFEGCADWNLDHIWLVGDTLFIPYMIPCPAWVMGHEMGHVAIHDGGHASPLWEEWKTPAVMAKVCFY